MVKGLDLTVTLCWVLVHHPALPIMMRLAREPVLSAVWRCCYGRGPARSAMMCPEDRTDCQVNYLRILSQVTEVTEVTIYNLQLGVEPLDGLLYQPHDLWA